MGRDKALIGWPDDPWAGRVVRAVAEAGVDDVTLVGGDRSRLTGLGEWIPDDHPGSGPAAAAATLADHRHGRPLLVAACDLPSLTGAAVSQVLDAVERGAAAAAPVVDDRPAWSILALSPGAAAALSDAVVAGARSLHGALERVEVRLLELDETPFVDRDSAP